MLAAALAGAACAQPRDPWPSRPVRLIVPAAAGGNPDVLVRLLGQKLQAALGKPFVVENVPGAGGVVAAEVTAKSAPDGHVIFISDSGALAINPALNSQLPYQPLRDFTFITALVSVPTVLVLHPSVAAQSLREFVALARAQPGRLSYGSAGTGSIHHLTMAVFASRSGIELLHVPYKGGTALVTGVLAGDVQAGWSGIPNVLQAIRTRRLRVLCISIPRRSRSLPDVPTAAELGFDGFDIATTIGLAASAGLSKDIVARLQAAAAKALREPDVAERIANLGMELVEEGTESFERLVRHDMARYASAVKAAGIKED